MMADRKRVEPLLRTARGQLEGVLRMIDENRYCMDIVTQLRRSNRSCTRRSGRCSAHI